MSAHSATTEENAQKVEVIPAAKEHEPALDDLLQLYAQDFREFHEIPLDENGRFHYNPLPLYWSDPARHAFLVKVDDSVAGFIFVKRGSEVSGNQDVWDMAEFFVMREFRRQGIGTQIAHEIWRRFPGSWEVRVMEANTFAMEFWVNAITRLIGEGYLLTPFSKDSESWKLFSFESQKN
ncbi:MAG TPA: GNAT family N-acetyltransferase [Terriglobales bacterium]|jgi:predicted acetyltransferase